MIKKYIKTINLRPLGTSVFLILLVVFIEAPSLPKLKLDLWSGPFSTILGSNLIGAIIGSIVAIAGSVYVSTSTLRKQQVQRRNDEELLKLRETNHKSVECEAKLNTYLTVARRNLRMMHNCATPDKIGNFMNTLPRPIVLKLDGLALLRSRQLAGYWTTVADRVEYTSHMVQDFVGSYKLIKDTAFVRQLHNEEIDHKYVFTSHEDIIQYAKDLEAILKDDIRIAVTSLAVFRIYGQNFSTGLFTSVEDVFAYELDEAELQGQELKVVEDFDLGLMLEEGEPIPNGGKAAQH